MLEPSRLHSCSPLSSSVSGFVVASRVTENDALSPPSDEGVATAWQNALIIVIVCPFATEMFTRFPFIVVVLLVNCTVPKLSSGNSRPRVLGASTIHSADDRDDA